jgi:hypothetical protein
MIWKWCSDCHAVGAEDAEAYGLMSSNTGASGALAIAMASRVGAIMRSPNMDRRF